MRFSEAMDSKRNRASGGSSFNSRLPSGLGFWVRLVLPVWLYSRLILEWELFTTMMSFNPSPSRSATCSWLIWLSMGNSSGPLKPKRLVLVFSARPVAIKLAPAAQITIQPTLCRNQVIVFKRRVKCQWTRPLKSAKRIVMAGADAYSPTKWAVTARECGERRCSQR